MNIEPVDDWIYFEDKTHWEKFVDHVKPDDMVNNPIKYPCYAWYVHTVYDDYSLYPGNDLVYAFVYPKLEI